MNIILKSKKTKKLKKKEVYDICKLKNTHWNYGLKNQKKWFENNIDNKDIHNLLFFNNKIIGYTCLRERIFTNQKKIEKKYLYFDTLIINKKYRKFRLGYKLMMFNSKIIKNNFKPSFLICKKGLFKFYKKYNWKLTKKNYFKIEDHKTKKRIMAFNFKLSNLSKTNIFINK